VSADAIARASCDWLDQERRLPEIAARGRECAERIGKADDSELACYWSRGGDLVEADRDARARVPKEARVASPWAHDGEDA
jgi:hypothetical protein